MERQTNKLEPTRNKNSTPKISVYSIYLIMVRLVTRWPGVVPFVSLLITVDRHTANTPRFRHRVPAVKLVWAAALCLMVIHHSHVKVYHSPITWLTLNRNRHTDNKDNKAFIDIRLRPGIATQLSAYGPLWPNVTTSIKLEVHNILQSRHRRIEPRPQGICTQNFV